uniref:Putative secreted protein n=1 Tax=Anopheles darlingi TaxID=43151 RepID=A0A2M4DFQ3_ANODA
MCVMRVYVVVVLYCFRCLFIMRLVYAAWVVPCLVLGVECARGIHHHLSYRRINKRGAAAGEDSHSAVLTFSRPLASAERVKRITQCHRQSLAPHVSSV